jgi:L-threonylcarbamoyladenylate synthase
MKTRVLKVNPANPEPEAIAEARAILLADGLVVIPTETVYGLAARALSRAAVQKVFAAKGRPLNEPLPVQVARPEMLAMVCRDVPDTARRLVQRFMPGPLTLVLPGSGMLPEIVTGGLFSVGVRIPNHPVALAVLKAVGEPLVVTSANLSDRLAPMDAEAVLRQLDGKVDLVLDAGQCTVGIESTVLDLTVQPPSLLREGAIRRAELEAEIRLQIAE